MAMTFRDRPEFIRGRRGEQTVAEHLKGHGWYVVPSYDFSGDDGEKAPKLIGLSDGFAIPDLDVSRAGRRAWCEVKTKASATLHRASGRLEHGISTRLLRAYLRVQEITGCPVFLVVIEEDTGAMIRGRLDVLMEHVRYYTGEQMGRGGMAFFLRGDFERLA